MKHTLIVLIILVLAGSVVFFPAYVDASVGLPGSAKFGYGARVDINGQYLNIAIATAYSIGLDWIAVEFDWEEMWPDPNLPPNISLLSEIITQANQNGLSVLLTISNPAEWAVTESGPDPQTTANLTLSLADFYSDKVLAIELFGGVNTQAVWKAVPDAEAYLLLLKRVQDTLKRAGKQISIITTVTPASLSASVNDIDDIDFLNELYKADGMSYLTVIGVKFNYISGVPYSNPGKSVLRHYEEIRSVMLNNAHSNGLIWITGFGWPHREFINLDTASSSPSLLDRQADWLEEAYSLMRAQLYIGAAFFDQINPPQNQSQASAETTLISEEANPHPAVDRISGLIRKSISGAQASIPDSSETEFIPSTGSNQTYLTILLKKYIRQNDFKHP